MLLSRLVCVRSFLNQFMVVAGVLGALCGAPRATIAATVSASASAFTGSSLSALVEIDDAADPGNLVITLSVDDGGYIGDLRGLFFQVADESLLAGLEASGSEVTSSVFSANNVINLGRGSNLNGGGTPCFCDIGIEFGSPGIGEDDLQSITFTLSHVSATLDISLLAAQAFGVRVTSVGDATGSRDLSSKLVGVVPEPSTALLMGLGLLGLGTARRRA
jgi:hypothetical protein